MEYAREIVMTSLRNNFSIFLFKYIGDGIRWECTVDFSSGASISVGPLYHNRIAISHDKLCANLN